MEKKKITYGISAVAIAAVLGTTYYIGNFQKENTGINQKLNSINQKSNSEKSNKVSLVIDEENKAVLSRNFRTTKDKISSDKAGTINLEGLSDLNISGSGTFSEKGLALIKEKIGSNSIADVDLRQESHGFVNGMSISWDGKNNSANKGLTKEQVIKDEKSKLNEISEKNYVSFDKSFMDKTGKDNTITEVKNPEKVQTEEELAKSLGIGYLRISVTDHLTPLDDQVDVFVQSTKNLPQNTWLHFHCRAGMGRTTTFMVMYDMMHNAKKASYNDIMKREVLIGGSDILSGSDEDKKNESKSRSDFIKEFYNYCHDNNDGFQTSWSQWLKNKG